MTDKTAKLILAAIALGLFLNALTPFVAPPLVSAQRSSTELQLENISKVLDRPFDINIRNDFRVLFRNLGRDLQDISKFLDMVADGTCLNDKIC